MQFDYPLLMPLPRDLRSKRNPKASITSRIWWRDDKYCIRLNDDFGSV